jgi:hypothetical protein
MYPDPKRLDSARRELNKRHITKDQMYFAMSGITQITWYSGPKRTK